MVIHGSFCIRKRKKHKKEKLISMHSCLNLHFSLTTEIFDCYSRSLVARISLICSILRIVDAPRKGNRFSVKR